MPSAEIDSASDHVLPWSSLSRACTPKGERRCPYDIKSRPSFSRNRCDGSPQTPMGCGAVHVLPPSADSHWSVSPALALLWLRSWTTIGPLLVCTACSSWYWRRSSPWRVGRSASHFHVRPSSVETQTPFFCSVVHSCLPA